MYYYLLKERETPLYESKLSKHQPACIQLIKPLLSLIVAHDPERILVYQESQWKGTCMRHIVSTW